MTEKTETLGNEKPSIEELPGLLQGIEQLLSPEEGAKLKAEGAELRKEGAKLKAEVANLRTGQKVIDQIKQIMQAYGVEPKKLTLENLPNTLEQLLEERPKEVKPLTKKETNFIYDLRDVVVEAASKIPQTRQQALGINIKRLKTEKQPAQLAQLLKGYFDPIISGYNRALNSLAAFKGQRTYLGTELVLNPLTYVYVKDKLNINELDEKALEGIRVSSSTLREHLEDAGWLYQRVQLRVKGPEIVEEIIERAGEEVLKRVRDYALERACETYDKKTGQGKLPQELIDSFKELDKYKNLEGEELQKAVRETIEQAAEVSYCRLVVNRLAEKNLTFNDIWDKCLKPFIEDYKQQEPTGEQRKEAEKIIAKIIAFQKYPGYFYKGELNGEDFSWWQQFLEAYDPETIADENARQQLYDIREGFSKPGNPNELYQRLAALILDNEEVRSRFFELENLIYTRAFELERAVKAHDEELESRDRRIKELEEQAREQTEGYKQLAEKIEKAQAEIEAERSRNKDLEGQLKEFKSKGEAKKEKELEAKLIKVRENLTSLYKEGAIDVIYQEAREYRNKKEYQAAVDKLTLAKNMIDIVTEVQDLPQYSHVDPELACTLLILSHHAKAQAQKSQYIYAAIGLSEPALSSPTSTEKAKVIAETNLHYAYIQLSKFAKDQGDLERERNFKEKAAKYNAPSDPDCKRLGLRRF